MYPSSLLRLSSSPHIYPLYVFFMRLSSSPSQPLNDPYKVTKEELVLALRKCLSASPFFAEHCWPMLLEKATSSMTSSKLDSFETIVRHNQERISKYFLSRVCVFEYPFLFHCSLPAVRSMVPMNLLSLQVHSGLPLDVRFCFPIMNLAQKLLYKRSETSLNYCVIILTLRSA